MEGLYIFLFLLAFTMVGVMFGFTIQEAFGDYFKTINIRFTDNPTTCIFEPEYDEEYFNQYQLYSVFTGIKEWENTMTLATGGDWYIPLYLYEWEEHIDKKVHDYLDCDIVITFEETNDLSRVGKTALGYTHFDHSWSKHKYSQIVVFTYNINTPHMIDLGEIKDNSEIVINLEPKRMEDSDIQHIIKHEFGHAVGLLHHYNTSGDENKSVMSPTFKPFTNYTMPIQPIDVNAMVILYGEDGWKHPNPIFLDKKIESLEWFIPKIVVSDVRVLLQ